VIEDAGSNYSAYVMGLDRVISTGATVEEVTGNMREVLEFHLEGMH
jgi:predicted RNase H-like HicB family nuclease